jgi:hypothetical protein
VVAATSFQTSPKAPLSELPIYNQNFTIDRFRTRPWLLEIAISKIVHLRTTNIAIATVLAKDATIVMRAANRPTLVTANLARYLIQLMKPVANARQLFEPNRP